MFLRGGVGNAIEVISDLAVAPEIPDHVDHSLVPIHPDGDGFVDASDAGQQGFVTKIIHGWLLSSSTQCLSIEYRPHSG